MIYTGEPGGSPEIYEKINTKNGKGCVVFFANATGTYNYITENKVAASYWSNEGVKFSFDKKGRANIMAEFNEPSTKIIFLIVNQLHQASIINPGKKFLRLKFLSFYRLQFL